MVRDRAKVASLIGSGILAFNLYENHRPWMTLEVTDNQRLNFRNFLERSLEDFFSEESMQIFETSLENVFGRVSE